MHLFRVNDRKKAGKPAAQLAAGVSQIRRYISVDVRTSSKAEIKYFAIILQAAAASAARPANRGLHNRVLVLPVTLGGSLSVTSTVGNEGNTGRSAAESYRGHRRAQSDVSSKTASCCILSNVALDSFLAQGRFIRMF